MIIRKKGAALLPSGGSLPHAALPAPPRSDAPPAASEKSLQTARSALDQARQQHAQLRKQHEALEKLLHDARQQEPCEPAAQPPSGSSTAYYLLLVSLALNAYLLFWRQRLPAGYQRLQPSA